jgi:hypothetical protein
MSWVTLEIENGEYVNAPSTGASVKAKVQHWHTKNIRTETLKKVNEDDVEWRTADDNSELSYDWDVIEWFNDKKIKE